MWYQLTISFPFLVCLFWCIFFLVRWLDGNGEQRVIRTLVCFYLAATILYLDHWLFFSDVRVAAGEWSYGVANLCVYPLYYAYLRSLTRFPKNWELPVLLLPALIALMLFPIGHFSGIINHDTMFFFIRCCFFIQVFWVLLRGFQLVRNTIMRMDDTYSDDRSRLLRPTHLWLILFAVTAVVSMVLNFIGREYFTHDAIVLIPAVVMSVLLYGLGFIAAHTSLPEDVAEENYQPETEEATDNLIHRIDATMREQMLYTRPNLTIYDVAKATNSNRTYISAAINRTYGISFSLYVTKQRVEYAKLILRDTRYTTDKAAVSDAILLSGFASEQTFYRVFKEQTGLTPLQFRQQKT